MIEDVQRLLDNYIKWLRDKTVLRQIDDRWVEITAPYLDRHNDYLQIYAKREDGGYLLTDDGYIIQDLEQSGCELSTPKRKALLDMTLNGFGIQNNNGVLEVRTSEGNFALHKHNLLQAMLAVNDLFYLAEPMVASLFYEDVVEWLEYNEIRYVPRVKFTGKSGYDYLFDFAIPKSQTRPERIVQAINQPTRESAVKMAFSWLDTREARSIQSPGSRAYAMLNDNKRGIPPIATETLRSYEVTPVPWSARDRVREELIA